MQCNATVSWWLGVEDASPEPRQQGASVPLGVSMARPLLAQLQNESACARQVSLRHEKNCLKREKG